jgi:type II secretory pathway component PulF
MLKMGIPVLASLEILSRGTAGAWSPVLAGVAARVRAGQGFVDAMARYPGFFSPLHVSMLQAGEANGAFPAALDRCACHLERSISLKRKAEAAMTYPTLVFLAAFAAITYLSLSVFPGSLEMANMMGTSLPRPITWFVSACLYAFRHPVKLAPVTLITILFFFAVFRGSTGKERLEKMWGVLPLSGRVLRLNQVSRFAHALSEGLSSGIEIGQAMALAAQSCGSPRLERGVQRIIPMIVGGMPLDQALAVIPWLPWEVCHAVHASHSAGNTCEALKRTAILYEGEADRAATRALAILEPVSLAIAGGLVALISLSVILPSYRLLEAI